MNNFFSRTAAHLFGEIATIRPNRFSMPVDAFPRLMDENLPTMPVTTAGEKKSASNLHINQPEAQAMAAPSPVSPAHVQDNNRVILATPNLSTELQEFAQGRENLASSLAVHQREGFSNTKPRIGNLKPEVDNKTLPEISPELNLPTVLQEHSSLLTSSNNQAAHTTVTRQLDGVLNKANLAQAWLDTTIAEQPMGDSLVPAKSALVGENAAEKRVKLSSSVAELALQPATLPASETQTPKGLARRQTINQDELSNAEPLPVANLIQAEPAVISSQSNSSAAGSQPQSSGGQFIQQEMTPAPVMSSAHSQGQIKANSLAVLESTQAILSAALNRQPSLKNDKAGVPVSQKLMLHSQEQTADFTDKEQMQPILAAKALKRIKPEIDSARLGEQSALLSQVTDVSDSLLKATNLNRQEQVSSISPSSSNAALAMELTGQLSKPSVTSASIATRQANSLSKLTEIPVRLSQENEQPKADRQVIKPNKALDITTSDSMPSVEAIVGQQPGQKKPELAKESVLARLTVKKAVADSELRSVAQPSHLNEEIRSHKRLDKQKSTISPLAKHNHLPSARKIHNSHSLRLPESSMPKSAVKITIARLKVQTKSKQPLNTVSRKFSSAVGLSLSDYLGQG
jgi:hypothetical protein